MSFDLSKFKSVATVNTKKAGAGAGAKKQEFANLKFRKSLGLKKEEDGKETSTVSSKFVVSTNRFNELNLNAYQLRPFFSEDRTQAVLAVVDPKFGQLLKARENMKKGKAFKSDKLEAVLTKTGVLLDKPVGWNQFISMESIGKGLVIDGVPTIEAFILGKGEEAQYSPESPVKAKAAAKKAAAEAQVADGKAETKAASAPTAAPAATVAAPTPAATTAVQEEEWT